MRVCLGSGITGSRDALSIVGATRHGRKMRACTKIEARSNQPQATEGLLDLVPVGRQFLWSTRERAVFCARLTPKTLTPSSINQSSNKTPQRLGLEKTTPNNLGCMEWSKKNGAETGLESLFRFVEALEGL